ncbi:serine/threonine-protein kinase 17A-like [Cimex lectularius]|uniref:non-specific serine/threonine protein kinase n=1 Tax=Cimex lectularius TaxID=79782 RepID=A0A8I6S0J8_CIMLE|nr:serine/threonine-protein kinase 17A-like [Cimex lectularius]
MRGVPECLRPTRGGYLELSGDLLQRIVITDPIEKFYEVEDEPFARGKYAAVRRCRERTSGRQFAAKFLRKRNRSKDHRNEILHEVAVLEACKPCNRVVNLHQVFESTNEIVLLLELACGGELQMLLDSDDFPTEGQVQTFMKQIMEGILYLHNMNVAHLDIKPQNLVLTGTFPECEVKLCDFGISRYCKGTDVREIVGTPDYIAPEILNYEPISLATDMWSVGVLLYVLLTGCSPFGGDTKQETFCNITHCRLEFPDDLFEDISEEAKDLMTKLIVKLPSGRLSAKECLQHPWFSKTFNDIGPFPPSKTVELIDHEKTQRLKVHIPEAHSTHKVVTEETTPEDTNNNKHNKNSHPLKGLKEERRQVLKTNLANLVNRLDNDTKLNRVDSFSRNRASGMQTLPSIRFNNNINIENTVFKFQRAVVIDEDEGFPPSPVSTDNSSISDSSSDTISDMSIDSSSDRSSIISLDDSLDYSYRLRQYSSCANLWEAVKNQKPTLKQWPPKECSDSFIKAMSRFRMEPKPKLTIYNGRQKSIGLDIIRKNDNQVVIREHKAINNHYTKTSELKCESVKSRIRKFQIPRPVPELDNIF